MELGADETLYCRGERLRHCYTSKKVVPTFIPGSYSPQCSGSRPKTLSAIPAGSHCIEIPAMQAGSKMDMLLMPPLFSVAQVRARAHVNGSRTAYRIRYRYAVRGVLVCSRSQVVFRRSLGTRLTGTVPVRSRDRPAGRTRTCQSRDVISPARAAPHYTSLVPMFSRLVRGQA